MRSSSYGWSFSVRTCPITDSIAAVLGSEDGNIFAGVERPR
jgi:hypothetical protein